MSRTEARAQPQPVAPIDFETSPKGPPERELRALGNRPIRMLRLAQVIDATGLGKTKIYELQAEGDFPMRVKITSYAVGWIEEEIQAWLARRIAGSCTVAR